MSFHLRDVVVGSTLFQGNASHHATLSSIRPDETFQLQSLSVAATSGTALSHTYSGLGLVGRPVKYVPQSREPIEL